MECGKLTAKLRDAVPVCFIVNGMEVKRLKNVEVPDEIKKLPFTAFKFDVPQNGAITFKIITTVRLTKKIRFERTNRIVDGHKITVRYIAGIAI